MSHKCFVVSIADNIAHILLSRPEKRNAMSIDFWNELPEIVKDIDENSKARVIVISSSGPVFSAGIDVTMLGSEVTGDGNKNHPSYGAGFLSTVKRLQGTFTALEECRIPVLVAIQGGCYGGGVDLITACDMRYGTPDSFITVFEIKVGMTADVGTFPRILNHLPEGLVRELAYTGRKMHADEAMAQGLFNQVYDTQENMMEAVMRIAAEIASMPPMAIYGCKRAITYGRDHSTADALDHIAVWNMSMLIPGEIMESMQANAQKRSGNFEDLPKIKTGK